MDEKTSTLTSEAFSEESSARIWQIVAIAGPDAGRSLLRESGVVTVGTDPTSDLILADDTVSRRHAALELHPDGVLVVDLGSTNGTYVGRSAIQRAYVAPGGVVRLGRTKLQFLPRPKDGDRSVDREGEFGEFVTTSPELKRTLSRLRIVAGAGVSVLIQGEYGTGKRLLARTLHERSHRAGGPLVVVPCDSISRADLGAHMFGRGEVQGVLAQANGGTVVLASAGDLPLDVQSALLELLETRMLRSEGAAPREVDLRFVFTDHRDLSALADSREFRLDLYYRAAVVVANIPPLRERPGDIVHLAEHFAQRLASGARTATGAEWNAGATPVAGDRVRIDQDLLEVMIRYSWPGNVRELAAVIERVMAGDTAPLVDRGAMVRSAESEPNPFREAKDQVIADFERRYVRTILALNGDNVSSAAREAGLSRGAFYALMRRAGVEPRFAQGSGGEEPSGGGGAEPDTSS